MGPFRSRDQRLPTVERNRSPTKERYSDDEDYYYSDDDLESYGHGASVGSSRATSGTLASSAPMLRPRPTTTTRRIANVYPYRLPTKVTRYLCLSLLGFLLLMILSLIRASQVENWKVANGEIEDRPPPPPPTWERFPFLERYYGGIRTLVPFSESKPEYPPTIGSGRSESLPVGVDLPTEGDVVQRDITKSQPWETHPQRVEEEGIKECFIDAAGTVRIPPLRYYDGRPKGFPRSVVGSYDLLGLPEDICFERFGRYGPYGFGYSIKSGGLGTGENGENEGSASTWQTTPRVDYRGVNWAEVQRRCYNANAARYKSLAPKTSTPHGFYIHDSQDSTSVLSPRSESGSSEFTGAGGQQEAEYASGDRSDAPTKVETSVQEKSRTAVVIRAWDEYLFREEDIAGLRSVITELALASGGRYDIHLLVQVKNDAANPIWADAEAYERRINETIPEEFRGLVTLWTETQMLSLYQGIFDLFSRGPDLPVHGVYRGLSMAMQYFAYMHPEYDYFWQWEMDIRYTGHFYDFFAKIERWAKSQPRKGIWERNARFYFPNVHGTWEDFSQMSRIQHEMGTVGADNVWRNIPGVNEEHPEETNKERKAVWGPVRPADNDDWFEPGNDPVPPYGAEHDRYEWGVGEEADFITLNPLFDPEGTTWGLRDDITGYNRTAGTIPRRAAIITASRMSRRLLLTMHKMTAYKKQFAFPEMWPATVALQHGFKAVYVPHPIYVDRRWPEEYMAQLYNGGRDGATGGARTSMYGDREHNMQGLSWFYNSGFSPNLYRRWLGLRVNNDGGEEFEKTVDHSKEGIGGVGNMPGGEGRMCLPPMLLHPVKDVDLPVEVPPEEGAEVQGTDPFA